MLGYTQEDVRNMIHALDSVTLYVDEEWHMDLIDAASLLEGLLAEGRI